MNPSPRYFVRVGNDVRGPYDQEQLRQLAEVGVITTATESAVLAEGPWIRMALLTEAAAIFPPRAALGFSEAAFERTTDATKPVELREIIAYSNTLDRVLRPSHPPELAAFHETKAATPPNEVEAMVREVREREARFAPPPPPPPKWRPSRRLTLVATLALVGNGVLVAIPTFYGGWGDMWSMVLVRGWFVIYNMGLVMAYFALPKE